MMKFTKRGLKKLLKEKFTDNFITGSIRLSLARSDSGFRWCDGSMIPNDAVKVGIDLMDDKGKAIATIEPQEVSFGNTLTIAGLKVRFEFTLE